MPQRNGGLGTALWEAEAQRCAGNSAGSGLGCTETRTSAPHADFTAAPKPWCCSCQPLPCPDPPEPAEQLWQHQARLGLGTAVASHLQPNAQDWELSPTGQR